MVGFDDLEFSALTHPPLTTVRQPRYEMGRRSWNLDGDPAGRGGRRRQSVLAPEITVRRSA